MNIAFHTDYARADAYSAAGPYFPADHSNEIGTMIDNL
jgi:hypothetical protein